MSGAAPAARDVRAAVVGVGHLGRLHAEKYAALDGVALVGVVDVDAERAHAVATALGTRVFADHRALAGAVDCATVAVPTRAHAAVAADLLAGGIDVLVEKPLASSVAEGAALVAAAAAAGRILQVGHVERFNPALRAAAEVVTEPRFLECHRLAPFTERGTDVDVIRDLMIHDLDVIQHFVGADVAAVESVGVPVLTALVDIANARIRFANGCIANVTASRVSVKRERKLRIFQPEAYVAIDYDQRTVRIFRRVAAATAGALAEITVAEHDVGAGRSAARGGRRLRRRGQDACRAARRRRRGAARARARRAHRREPRAGAVSEHD